MSPIPPAAAAAAARPPDRPLLVTADEQVLDDVLRLAATAGVELEVVADAARARRGWARPGLVVVGPDAVRALARLRLPRRSGVVLLGDLDDAGVWQLAVEVGAERVVFLPDGEEWLAGALADAAEGAGRDGRLVAVLGGRGGAGATTLASALALTGSRAGHDVLLVDGDPLGGGIDLVFGGEQDSGVRWPDLGDTRGRVPAAALAQALPRMAGLSVLSWDRRTAAASAPGEAVRAVLAAGRRAHDLVVVDLPRACDDAARVALSTACCALLVVPAEVRAAAAAARVAAVAGALCGDLRVVVRAPGPSGLDGVAVARALGLPLAGEMRPEPGLDAALERGEPPARRGRGPLADLCAVLLDELVPAAGQAA